MAKLSVAPLVLCFLVTFTKIDCFVYVESDSNRSGDQKVDDKVIAEGRSYRIRNKHSDLYLTEVGGGRNIVQSPLVHDANRASQVWYVVSIDNNRYRFANKLTGLSLVTDYNRKTAGTNVIQHVMQTHNPADATETWLIEHDIKANGIHYYLVRNELSFLCFSISLPSSPGSIVVQWPLYEDNPANRVSQQWAFEVEEEFPAVLEANRKVNRNVEDIGDVTRITSWHQTKPSKTDEVLIGQLSIPFPLIVEPRMNLSQQAILSPYYFLRRYGYWQMVTYHEHGGTSQVTMTTNVNIGLISDNANRIRSITGLSVNADSALGLVGLRPRLIKSKIANGLRINVYEESTELNNKTIQLERKYVNLNRQTDAIWFREDRFVLERINGERVIDWITRVPVTINDGFRGHQKLFT